VSVVEGQQDAIHRVHVLIAIHGPEQTRAVLGEDRRHVHAEASLLLFEVGIACLEQLAEGGQIRVPLRRRQPLDLRILEPSGALPRALRRGATDVDQPGQDQGRRAART